MDRPSPRRDRRRAMTTLVFFPEVPHEKYVINPVCRHLGYEISGDLARVEQLVVTFSDRTVRDDFPALAELPAHVRVVSRAAVDISKSRVERAQSDSFGYGTFVDPLQFSGACVVKSEINARRDGRIVKCPLAFVEPGSVYQRAVDNR